jgi:hypothetical protein
MSEEARRHRLGIPQDASPVEAMRILSKSANPRAARRANEWLAKAGETETAPDAGTSNDNKDQKT